jgi:hypothetical protein
MLACTVMASVPIILIPSKLHSKPVDIAKIVELVHTHSELDQSIHSQARVSVMFNGSNIDYLVIQLLSKHSYSVVSKQIKINQKYEIVSVDHSYQVQERDHEEHYGSEKLTCPDEDVQFVVGTPVPDYPTAKAATDNVFKQAQANGLKAVQLYGPKASVQNYKNYLSCPKLKGFFNVGHGYNEGILLNDGTLTHVTFTNELKDKFQEAAVIVFNSCEVVNEPLKSAIAKDSDVQKFIGGITTLLIGPSEKASICFWEATFKGAEMSKSVKECNAKFDSSDVFGIEGEGEEIFHPDQDPTPKSEINFLKASFDDILKYLN